MERIFIEESESRFRKKIIKESIDEPKEIESLRENITIENDRIGFENNF
jgi:hypothetical protein